MRVSVVQGLHVEGFGYMRLKNPVGRLLYCHSSAPETLLGDVIFRGERGIIIGSSSPDEGVDICLEDPHISGHHAHIIWENDKFWIKSLSNHPYGIRRYAQRFKKGEHVELFCFDYFSLPGKDLGNPEGRYICLFVNVNATRVGLGYKPVAPDPVRPYDLYVFGGVVNLPPALHTIFDYLQDTKGVFVSYDDIVRKLWPDLGKSAVDEYDLQNMEETVEIYKGKPAFNEYDLQNMKETVETYVNRLRRALDRWSSASNSTAKPSLLFHERQRKQGKVRLCLDDFIPALEMRAYIEPTKAQESELLAGNKDLLWLIQRQ